MKKLFQLISVKSFLALSLICFSFVLFTGCGNDDTAPVINTHETSFLSFVHASPDAPNIDLYIGNALAQANIPYLGEMPYLPFNAGSNQILVRVTSTSDTLIDSTVDLQSTLFYSLFVIDSLSVIKPMLFTDNLAPPLITNCNVRFLNLSPNSQALALQAEGTTQPWFSFYSFPPVPGSALYNFTPTASGLYNLDLKVAGSSTVLFTLPNTALVQGTIYTIIANGFQNGTGGQAIGLTVFDNN